VVRHNKALYRTTQTVIFFAKAQKKLPVSSAGKLGVKLAIEDSIIKILTIWIVTISGFIGFGYLNFVEIEGFEPNKFYMLGFIVFTLATVFMILYDPLAPHDKNEGRDTTNTYIDSGHDCGE
jgi:hypothetical protein